MCKAGVILEEIVFQHHPKFCGDTRAAKSVRKVLREDPMNSNIAYLVECCLAAVGGYKRVDAAGYDFSDNSDAKTASVRENAYGTSVNCFQGEIPGITTADGTLKSGALRVVIHVPQNDTLRYYYLPRSFWSKNINVHKRSGKGRLLFTYNQETDTIAKLDAYRVGSFVALAQAK